MHGFVCGFDNRIIAYAVLLKILPSIVYTIVVVAGTYGSAVSPFITLIDST